MAQIFRVIDKRRALCEYPLQLVNGLDDEELLYLIRVADNVDQSTRQAGKVPSRMMGWLCGVLSQLRTQRETPGCEIGILEMPKSLYSDDVSEVGRSLGELLIVAQSCITLRQSAFVGELLSDMCAIASFYLESYEKERAVFLARNPKIRDVDYEEE